MYGFIPQTWCNEEIAQLCAQRIGRKEIVADQDPLDICVIDEGTKTEIAHVYGREEAYEVIRRAHNDYSKRLSRLESLLEDALAEE